MVKKRGHNIDPVSAEIPVALENKIRLAAKEQKVIRILLEDGHKSVDEWGDYQSIAQRLYEGEHHLVHRWRSAKDRLKKIMPKLARYGIYVQKKNIDGKKAPVFSLRPEDESRIEQICDNWSTDSLGKTVYAETNLEESTDGFMFTPKEQKVIKTLIEFGYRDPDRWCGYQRLAERMYAPNEKIEGRPADAARRTLRHVEKKLNAIGVDVKETKSRVYNTLVFSINPEDESKIEAVCKNWRPEKNEDVLYLALGELGFGTKAYDPRAGKGLGYFLKHNKIKDKSLKDSLDMVVLNGGLIPFVPEFYTSAIGANSMHLLDKKADGEDAAEVDDAEAEKRIAEVLKSVDIDDELKNFYIKHVSRKIRTKTDAVTTARHRLDEIIGDDYKGKVHYVYGEEDDANLLQLKEIEIVRLIQKTAEIKKQHVALEKDVEKLREEQVEYVHEKKMLENMSMWLTRAVDYKGSKFKENVAEFLQYHKKELKALNEVSSNLGKNVIEFLEKAKSKEHVEKKVTEVYAHLKKVDARIKDGESQEADLITRLNAVKREAEAPGFFKITKRVQLDAEQHELLWAQVSKKYAAQLKGAFPNKVFELHPESRADVSLKDRIFRLEHTMNQRSSNPEKDALKRQKEQAALANKRGERVPDVYLTAHGEGMRDQPQPKYRESIERGTYRETPQINMLIKQGTFHSGPKLEYLRRNKLKKNWMVKRAEKNHSSGALIHRIAPNGVQSMLCLPIEDLIELGLVAEQLEQAYASLAATKGTEKKAVQEKISELEAKFLIENEDDKKDIKITILTDTHIGSPTWPGRPSNYAFIDAAIKYEEEKRLPNVLVMTEMIHGALRRPYSSDKEYLKMTRAELEQAIKNIYADTTLSGDERTKLFSTLLLMEDAQTPIPLLDDQCHVFDAKIAPFAKKVIATDGLVTIASGNHAQNTTDVFEEATALARAFTPEERKAVELLQAKGTSYGSGMVSLDMFGDKRKIYVAHRLRRGSDEVAGIKEQIKGMNLTDTLVIGGDAHQACKEYADGTTMVIGAGIQSWNPYVDEVGKQGGLRGVVDIFLSRNPLLQHTTRIDYVLDPTLEAYVKDIIETEKKLVEKYIPHP